MRRLIFFIIFFGLFFYSNSQQQVEPDMRDVAKVVDAVKEPKKANLWKTLAKITYIKEYDEFLGFKIDKPVFAESVRALEGKEVTVRGYIIPTEGYKNHEEFIFSAYPYSMCFFCGGAGPETVMEVEASEPVKYTTEQIILKGKLQLNADDINRLMYVLVDAVIVKG